MFERWYYLVSMLVWIGSWNLQWEEGGREYEARVTLTSDYKAKVVVYRTGEESGFEYEGRWLPSYRKLHIVAPLKYREIFINRPMFAVTLEHVKGAHYVFWSEYAADREVQSEAYLEKAGK